MATLMLKGCPTLSAEAAKSFKEFPVAQLLVRTTVTAEEPGCGKVCRLPRGVLSAKLLGGNRVRLLIAKRVRSRWGSEDRKVNLENCFAGAKAGGVEAK